MKRFKNRLSAIEMDRIEHIYNIKLPKEFRRIYGDKIPKKDYLYVWNDFSDENISMIKETMDRPKQDLLDLIEDIAWLEEYWGECPINPEERKKQIIDKINDAPTLIPICGHRYIVESEAEQSPVLSMVGLDIIYFSQSLYAYFREEEGPMYLSDYEHMGFWTDMMEQ